MNPNCNLNWDFNYKVMILNIFLSLLSLHPSLFNEYSLYNELRLTKLDSVQGRTIFVDIGLI